MIFYYSYYMNEYLAAFVSLEMAINIVKFVGPSIREFKKSRSESFTKNMSILQNETI